jgi:hypothetical protein
MKKKKELPLKSRKKLYNFNDKLINLMQTYCIENNIKSESDLVRRAIEHYCIDRGYDDNSLQLQGIKNLESKIEELKYMISILFNYTHMAHESNLLYHAELDKNQIDTAIDSAQFRIGTFYKAFQQRLRDNPVIFDKLLHDLFSGSLNGQSGG